MGIFDFLFMKSSKDEQEQVKLTSYMEAAELICKCWNNLDTNIIEPYLSENIEWKGETRSGPLNDSVWVIGKPITIEGKQNYLKYLEKVFDTLRLIKNSHRADIVCENGEYRARISIDNQDEDEVNRLKIEDGLITEIEIMPSFEWWNTTIDEEMPFGVVSQTSFHEQAAAVAAIEQYVKTELNNKPIKWARPYDLKNSHCQLSFTCDGLSYDILIEIQSWDSKCRFVMASEYERLMAGSKEIDHVPCILALDADYNFVSLTLLEDMDVRVQKLRAKGMNEWTFRALFKTKAQLSRLVITKDHRITLPDYNEKEVKMEPLVKAVYFLFLKHSEGIIFKELSDYREELLDIYKDLKPLGLSKRTIQSIEDVTNPLLNSINEKCARIRSAFIKEFDEGLAKNYFVTGERGEVKKISLPRDLVTWE